MKESLPAWIEDCPNIHLRYRRDSAKKPFPASEKVLWRYANEVRSSEQKGFFPLQMVLKLRQDHVRVFRL